MRLALGGYLSHKNVPRLHFSTQTDNPALVQVCRARAALSGQIVHVHRARRGACIIVKIRTDERAIADDRDIHAEIVRRRRVGRAEFTFIGPCAVEIVVDVRDAGLAAGDFETYALWQRRRRAAERLLQTRQTGVQAPGGKA